ncbi:MAG: DUF502 domain-containing protein [Candidatus Hydrogenedentes bacterium]|nr:DUF502 domain-containing protein [Candidatus Hydrogenedentota bacterium]
MKKSKSSRMRTIFVHRLRTTIRGYMLRGILVVVPLGVTAYVLGLCYELTAGHLVPFLRLYTGDWPNYSVVLLSVVLFIVILYVIGFFAGFVIGRRLIAFSESFLRRIPLVKTIYGASRQAVDVLSRQDEGPAYQAAVLVPFPAPELRTIAFVTGKLHFEGEGEYVRTFVPTTPNPTSGYLEIFRRDAVEYTTLTIEAAAKTVMSAGTLTPEEFSFVEPPEMHAPPQEGLRTVTADGAMKRASKPKHSWPVRALLKVRRRLISGLLVLVPIGITIFITNFVYGLTAGRITPLAKWLAGPQPTYVTAVVSVILLVILLYLTGYVTTAVVGARLVRMIENLISRLPLITTVYGATKQIVETLVKPGSGPKFEAAAIVEFPYPGVRSLGFIVGKMRDTNGKLYVKVFVPTTPNITVGILQLYETSQVSACSLSLEEAIKMAVSCGLIGPDTISLRPITELDGYVEEPVPRAAR